MRVEFLPSAARGEFTAPPSKSILHRALICAALARGESRICPASDSRDVAATAGALTALGTTVARREDGFLVAGTGGRLTFSDGQTLRCDESASTLRFLLPLCLLEEKPTRLCGAPSLMSRPLSVYEALCRERGWTFVRDGEEGIRVGGRLCAGEYRVRGDVSSQFVSGMMLALPLTGGESRILLIPPVESRPYIELTRQVQSAFGVDVVWEDENTLRIPGGAYRPCDRFSVEGDASQAAFFAALNCVPPDRGARNRLDLHDTALSRAEPECAKEQGKPWSCTDGAVRVRGLSPDTRQGDAVFLDYFAALCAGAPTLEVSDCPDLFPVLCVVAAMNRGGVLTGTRRLGFKECDRACAMARELEKCGVLVTLGENRVTIADARETLKRPYRPLDGHGDHRIVMALSVLLSRLGGEIDGGEAVSKSFPKFFDCMRALGVRVTCRPSESERENEDLKHEHGI